MPQPTAAQIAVAALSFELAADGETVPTEAHLLPPGPFRAVDGRPFECAGWQLDAVIASALVALAAGRKNDILIDFEHQSLRSLENGKRVEAAGWIPRTLEWREGKGLYAKNINWVGDTAQLIKDKKVRYISALFTYDAITGAVLEILSVGLTNTPALDGLEALAALARTHYIDSSKEVAVMPGETEKLAALTQERDGLKTNVAALTQERDGLKTQVAALTQERDALKAKEATAAADKEKAEHAALLQAALNDGRLAPAQKAWAEKLSLAALTECLATLTPIAMLTKQTPGLDPAGNTHGLTDVEKAACDRMGVAYADFQKTKAV